MKEGKISKDLFKYNDDRMKKESAKIIKKINNFADLGIDLINKINKEIKSQKTGIKKKSKKIKIENGGKKIKKVSKKKPKIKTEPTPAPSTGPTPPESPSPPPQ